MKELKDKILEALISVLPITGIVYLVSLLPWFNFTAAELISFTVGAVLLILGIGLFNLGADLAMTPMGTHVGAGLSRQRKLWLLLIVCFVLGMLITVAEPDLQVLANQVKTVMNGTLLVYTVGIGVGAFLIVYILRIVFRLRCRSVVLKSIFSEKHVIPRSRAKWESVWETPGFWKSRKNGMFLERIATPHGPQAAYVAQPPAGRLLARSCGALALNDRLINILNRHRSCDAGHFYASLGIFFMVRPMRWRFSSTSSTATLTISPTFTASLG